MEEGVIKKLMASVKCGVCGQRYEVDNISILNHHEDLWFLSASCVACDTQCLMVAIIKKDKVLKVITDLTEAELDKFRHMDKLTADEMLDMHNFLKDFNGDFSQLFSQK